MSLEIRMNAAGTDFECDWGRFDNAEADPYRECGLKHLMLTTASYATELLTTGPVCTGSHSDVHSATRDGERLFAHIDHDGGRATWELFDAHFWDGLGPIDILIGRWPD